MTFSSYDSMVYGFHHPRADSYPYDDPVDHHAVDRFTTACLVGGMSDFIRTDLSWTSGDFSTLESLAERYFAPSSDLYYMAIALFAAHMNIKSARPNPCVGCVYVRDHQIIGCGYTDAYGGLHGEVRAATTSSSQILDLRGAVAYVILEPCCHRGNRSCAHFFIASQVSRVVVGVIDPDPRVSGRGVMMMAQAGMSVQVGLLGVAASRLLQPYLYDRHRRADAKIYLAAKWAQSMNGRLAAPSGNSQWISHPSSLVYSQWLRYIYDGVMVGAQTFITDKPSLGLRHAFMIPPQSMPIKLIFDPHLRAFQHRCFQDHYEHLVMDGAMVVWIATQESFHQWQKSTEYEEHPYHQMDEVLKGRFFFKLNSKDLIGSLIDFLAFESWQHSHLSGRRIRSVMVEGGPRLHGLLLGRAVYDVLHVVTSPKWLGGEYSITPSGPLLPHGIDDPCLYGWVSSYNFDGDMLSEYARKI